MNSPPPVTQIALAETLQFGERLPPSAVAGNATKNPSAHAAANDRARWVSRLDSNRRLLGVKLERDILNPLVSLNDL
jgi:hypothetical protein